MESAGQTQKRLCQQKGAMDCSTRQEKCWGWRRNPAWWFHRWSQRVMKPQPELSGTFLPSSWPRHLIPAPPPKLCGHAAYWGTPGPQVGCLGGSKVRGNVSHLRSLSGGQLMFKICIKLLWNCTHRAEACLVFVNMQWMKFGPGETNFNQLLMEQGQDLS